MKKLFTQKRKILIKPVINLLMFKINPHFITMGQRG